MQRFTNDADIMTINHCSRAVSVLKFIYALTGVAVLSACVAVPDVVMQTKPAGATAIQLSSAATVSAVCVLFPQDQANGQEKYPGSGAEIGLRVQQAVDEAGWKTISIKNNSAKPSDACLQSGGLYLLEAIVEHYEDNYTGWSGKPDRIELQLRLSLASNPGLVREATYEAKSNVAASGLLEWGNAKPVSLLRSDFDYLVKRLLRDISR